MNDAFHGEPSEFVHNEALRRALAAAQPDGG